MTNPARWVGPSGVIRLPDLHVVQSHVVHLRVVHPAI
jgi:hypothetical protein